MTTGATESGRTFLPLTDWILRHLPRRRATWIAAWATVPWINAAANLALGAEDASPVWEQDPVLVVLNYVAVSFAVVMSLWGTTRIARALENLLMTPSRSLAGRGDVPGYE